MVEARPNSFFIILLLTLSCSVVCGQTWVTTTEDYVADQVRRIIQTRDGRFLGVADTGRALTLIKRNSDGTLLWQRLMMGIPTGEAGHDVLELEDGRIVAAGDIYMVGHGNDDMGLAIFSADAKTVLRQRTIGGPGGDDRAFALLRAQDGGYLLAGETLSWGTPGKRMLVSRLDMNLNLIWAKVFKSSAGDESLYSGVELPSLDFILVGSDGTVLKLDGADGSLLWSRNYNATEIRKIVATSDGNYAMAGRRTTTSGDVAELIKINAAGDILWRASYGEAGTTYRFFALAPLNDGGFLAGGEINRDLEFDGWIVRLNAIGEIVWQRFLQDNFGEVHSIAQTAESAVLIGGHRNSFPSMMMARADSTGQAAGCDHSTTFAIKSTNNLAWTELPLTVIEPINLAIQESDKQIQDASLPDPITFCQAGPTFPPSEVSPPAASDNPLRFQDDQSLMWENASPSASTTFQLYRGSLEGGAPELHCFLGNLQSNAATDPSVPEPGQVFVYVVSGINEAGAGTLGHASDGSDRIPVTPCP